MEQYVITIARQFGSLGRLIGKKLAGDLNIGYYDRELIEQAAEIMKKPVSAISDYDETVKSRFSKMLYPMGMESSVMQTKLFELQKMIILDGASRESCVIVGRCGDYILKDYKNSIHIFIYAPYENRMDNCIHELNLQKEEAEKMIHSVDKAREMYYKHYTNRDLFSIEGKHLMIDSSLLGVGGTVELIKGIVKRKFGR